MKIDRTKDPIQHTIGGELNVDVLHSPSLHDLAYSQSYLEEVNKKITDDGGTTYPTDAAASLAVVKELDLMKELKLAYYPMGSKAGVAYSAKPFTAGQFTTTRALDTATKVNEDGYIEGVLANVLRTDYTSGDAVTLTEPERENLLGYSESFGNSYWTKSGATIEGDPSTAGAEKILTTSGDADNNDFDTDAGWWTKETNVTIPADGLCHFTATPNNNGILSPTNFVELNKLYRVTFTISDYSSGSARIQLGGTFGTPRNSDGTFTQDLLVESLSTGRMYIRVLSTTTLNITDVTIYELSGFSSPSADYPLGAYKLVESAVDEVHLIKNINSGTTVNAKTLSVYVKPSGRTKIGLREGAITGRSGAFDLTTQTLLWSTGVDDYSIITMVDGWYRISITFPTSTSMRTEAYLLSDTYTTGAFNALTYTGDGTSGIYIYGAQLEEGSYPTSYIRSEAGGTVTRSADAVTGAGDATTFASVNSSGVLYAEIGALADDGTTRSLSISDGSNTNRILLRYSSTTNQITTIVTLGTNVQATLNYTVTDVTDFHKVAVRWAVDDFSLWIDCVEVGTDVSGSIFPASTFTTVNFNSGGGSWIFYSNTKQIAVYNYLTDEQMISLTTP